MPFFYLLMTCRAKVQAKWFHVTSVSRYAVALMPKEICFKVHFHRVCLAAHQIVFLSLWNVCSWDLKAPKRIQSTVLQCYIFPSQYATNIMEKLYSVRLQGTKTLLNQPQTHNSYHMWIRKFKGAKMKCVKLWKISFSWLFKLKTNNRNSYNCLCLLLWKKRNKLSESTTLSQKTEWCSKTMFFTINLIIFTGWFKNPHVLHDKKKPQDEDQ